MRSLLFLVLIGMGWAAWGQEGTPEERLFAAIDEGKELVGEGVLVGGNVNLDARNAQGETPLHRAVEKGMKVLSRALAKAGSSLRSRSNSGETALHIAALHVDPDLTAFLLGVGADVRVRNDEGETPLHWAALSGNVSVAALLLEKGADPNLADIKGNRPLHAAADSGNIELVRLLLAHRSDPEAKNREGLSAGDIANERSHPDVAALLSKAVPPPSGAGNYGTIDVDKQPLQRF